MSKTPSQHQNDAITAPLPVITHDGQQLTLRPLSLGALNLLQRVGNLFFTESDDSQVSDADMLTAALEAVYILAAPLDPVRRACFGQRSEFELAVQIFAEGISMDNFDEVLNAISDQKGSAEAAIVVPRPDSSTDDQDSDPNVYGQSGPLVS